MFLRIGINENDQLESITSIISKGARKIRDPGCFFHS